MARIRQPRRAKGSPSTEVRAHPSEINRIVQAVLAESRAEELVPPDLRKNIEAVAILSRNADPVAGKILDGQIAAVEPELLLREYLLLHRGADGAYERIIASVDLQEIKALTLLCRLALGRMAEIRAAIDPLVRVPS